MSRWTDLDSLRADPSDMAMWRLEQLSAFGFCDQAGTCPVGTAPVLAVMDSAVTGSGAALFRVEVGPAQGPWVAMGAEAAEGSRVALSVVRRELGGLRPGRMGSELEPRLRRVWDGTGAPTVDGASLGLPTALAGASWLLDLPVPATVAASARVAPDGRLAPVNGLPGKLELLAAWAPQVRSLLVARGQELPPGPLRVEVVEVGDLREALEKTWPALAGSGLEDRVLESEDGPALARRLFGLAVRGAPQVLAWGGVQRLTERLRPRVDGEAAWQAAVVEAIAARHDADNRVPLPLPDLAGLPWSLRLDLRAQEVQHLADQAGEGWQGLARIAEEEAVAAQGLEGAARIHGALGRLHAAWGGLEAARAHLETAWRAWQDLYLEGQGGRALCEWMRLLGAAGDRDGLVGLVKQALPAAWEHADCQEKDRAHLALAAGRALVQAGAPEEAARWLEDRPGEGLDTRASRLRWRLQVCLDPGDEAELDTLPGPLGAEARALVALDRGGQDLAALERTEVERLLSWRPEGTSPARHVARWWRY